MKCEACAKCGRTQGTQRTPQWAESSVCVPISHIDVQVLTEGNVSEPKPM